MTYAIAKQVKAALTQTMDDASAKLQAWDAHGKTAMGLTPDHIKANRDYRADKNAFDLAFQNVRNFNAKFNKMYKKEIQAERREKMRALDKFKI